jgi:hypothetical protein
MRQRTYEISKPSSRNQQNRATPTQCKTIHGRRYINVHQHPTSCWDNLKSHLGGSLSRNSAARFATGAAHHIAQHHHETQRLLIWWHPLTARNWHSNGETMCMFVRNFELRTARSTKDYGAFPWIPTYAKAIHRRHVQNLDRKWRGRMGTIQKGIRWIWTTKMDMQWSKQLSNLSGPRLNDQCRENHRNKMFVKPKNLHSRSSKPTAQSTKPHDRTICHSLL